MLVWIGDHTLVAAGLMLATATLVGLAFPDGVEANDVYGRLLCHVILADGTDFNLKLVELGKSPYFNKYGNSRICHDEFVATQAAAPTITAAMTVARSGSPPP